MIRLIGLPLLIAGLATSGACTGRAQSAPDQPAATTERTPPDSARTASPPASGPITWLTSDSATRTAKLTLEVTRPAGAPSALLNGYRAGEAQAVVPFGWTVRWNWRNTDAASPHSLVVMVQREKIPLEGGSPAFSNAMTRAVTAGLPAGQTDQTTFQAEEAGWYWMLCGVPEHALAGEWIELQVSREAQMASVVIKKRGS